MEFFTTKKGWVKAADLRVKAMGHGGALMRAVREGKRLVLMPRQRVAQVRVTIIPVPKRKGGGP